MILQCNFRQKKLKEARRVAEEKIEKHKAELEANFERQKRERYGDMGDQEEIEAETMEEIQSIQQDFKAHKNDVINFLVERTLDVNLEIPRVVKGNFDDQ